MNLNVSPIDSKTIILIGGAPTTGKSTMAAQLSRQLQIPWMSTDQIRDIMRLVARREDYSALFTPEGYGAERFLTEFSAEQIADMELAQGEAVWPGIKAFIEDNYTWKDGFILEGVNILPHLIKRDFAESKHIKTVFLIDEDADRIRHVVFTRGLWDDAQLYADDVKEKEVAWVLDFSRKITSEAQRCGYPCVEVSKKADDLPAVIKALGL